MKYVKRFVSTSDFPYAVDFDVITAEIDEIFERCEQQFGPPLYRYADNNTPCKWIRTMFGVRFRKKEHQHWFIMGLS
jgi:hypothetical protein